MSTHTIDQRPGPDPRPGAIAALMALLLGAILGTGGCRSTRPRIAEGQFQGPTIAAGLGESLHVLTVLSPSPGWRVQADRSVRTRDGHDVYITLRRPDPQFLYPQVIVEQNLLTDVRTDSAIRVLARVLDHDHRDPKAPYRPVELRTDTIGPPPPSGSR